MKKIKLSLVDREVLEYKLHAKYQKIRGLKVTGVDVFQQEDVNNNSITTVKFYYGFLETKVVEFRYDNEELFTVSGSDIQMKFIDEMIVEMKNLLKEYHK